jgi:hypothetical protein
MRREDLLQGCARYLRNPAHPPHTQRALAPLAMQAASVPASGMARAMRPSMTAASQKDNDWSFIAPAVIRGRANQVRDRPLQAEKRYGSQHFAQLER